MTRSPFETLAILTSAVRGELYHMERIRESLAPVARPHQVSLHVADDLVALYREHVPELVAAVDAVARSLSHQWLTGAEARWLQVLDRELRQLSAGACELAARGEALRRALH